jgi:hypothetical protein
VTGGYPNERVFRGLKISDMLVRRSGTTRESARLNGPSANQNVRPPFTLGRMRSRSDFSSEIAVPNGLDPRGANS